MVSFEPRLDPTSVFDANREPIGRIIGSELSGNTREPTSLLVELDPNLHPHLADDERAVWLPFESVRSIRRGEMELDDEVHDLLTELGAGFQAVPAPDVTAGSD